MRHQSAVPREQRIRAVAPHADYRMVGDALDRGRRLVAGRYEGIAHHLEGDEVHADFADMGQLFLDAVGGIGLLARSRMLCLHRFVYRSTLMTRLPYLSGVQRVPGGITVVVSGCSTIGRPFEWHADRQLAPFVDCRLDKA